MSMGTGEDLANIAAITTKDTIEKTTETSLKATGNLIKIFLEDMLERMKARPEKIKIGRTKLETILRSGQDIKTIEMNKGDVRDFEKAVKQYGLQIAVVKQRNKEERTILFKAGDMERIQKSFELVLDNKLMKHQQADGLRRIQQIEKHQPDRISMHEDKPSVREKLKTIRKNREKTDRDKSSFLAKTKEKVRGKEERQ